jgi:cysteinyl-tRNA synthetase
LFDLIRESNSGLDGGTTTPGQAAQLLTDWRRIDSVLGFEREASAIPTDVQQLVDEREKVRTARDWKKSDELRDAILALGWLVKDTKDGSKLTPR